jgi:hypothetical protein
MYPVCCIPRATYLVCYIPRLYIWFAVFPGLHILVCCIPRATYLVCYIPRLYISQGYISWFAVFLGLHIWFAVSPGYLSRCCVPRLHIQFYVFPGYISSLLYFQATYPDCCIPGYQPVCCIPGQDSAAAIRFYSYCLSIFCRSMNWRAKEGYAITVAPNIARDLFHENPASI